MATETMIDPQFKQMLGILHHGGAYGHWWNKHPQTGSRATEWFPVSEPTAPTNGIVDAYFGVHPTITIPPVNRHNEPATPENVRSQIRYIAAINCLFGEYDAKNYDNGKVGALEHIESIEPSPSIIVDSGGGYHVYWLLNETWPLNDGEDRQEAKDIQARWVDYVGSDKDAKDLARVLRVPGTHNLKYAHKPTVTFVKFEPKLQYELDYLCSFLVPTQKPQEAPTAPITVSVDTDSVRLSAYLTRALNDEIAHVATVQTDKHFNLRDAAIRVGSLIPHGLNEDEAFNALYNAISGRAKDTRNAAETIRDGFEYGKKEPRKIEDKFKAEQPDFRADGTALCPTHKTPLVKAFSGNGYRCADEVMCFWWQGEGYVPPIITTVHAVNPDVECSDYEVNPTHKYIHVDELYKLPPPDWLIKGELLRRGLNVMYGVHGTGKSFRVLDYAARVSQHAPVMYVAAEDPAGYYPRIEAWKKYFQMDTPHLYMWPEPVNCLDVACVDVFISQIRNLKPELVIFDTLAQCMPGGDDTKQGDMGMFIRMCNAVRMQIGSSILVVHHANRNGEYRGHSSLPGAADIFTKFEDKDGLKIITVEKCKQAKAIDPIKLRQLSIDVSHLNLKEFPDSLVLVPHNEVDDMRTDDLSPQQMKIMEVVCYTIFDGAGVAPRTIGEITSIPNSSLYYTLSVLRKRNIVEPGSTKGTLRATPSGRELFTRQWKRQTR